MKRNLMLIAMIFSIVLLAGFAAAEGGHGVVNINKASAEQLQLLPRIGPALAGRILEFRQKNGDFHSVDELQAVRGVGERSLESLRPYLSVSGETTLNENRDSMHEFATLFFGIDTHWWKPKYMANTPENVQAALRSIDALEGSGGIDIYDALMMALATPGADTVCLVSNGPTLSGTVTDPSGFR